MDNLNFKFDGNPLKAHDAMSIRSRWPILATIFKKWTKNEVLYGLLQRGGNRN
jgi:hypothetical protein